MLSQQKTSAPAHWLLKTEPEEFSFTDLIKKGPSPWDGIRNYQARNFLLKMKKGDFAFIYHTGKEKSIVGITQIKKEAYPDLKTTSAESKKSEWFQIDVSAIKSFIKPVPLETIKNSPHLKNMLLLKQTRLSVMPLSLSEWNCILNLAHTPMEGLHP